MKRMWSKNELLSLSNAEIRKLIESGEIDNAKPVYCHPLEMYVSGISILTALIFNNSPEKIDSWTKVKDAIKSFNPKGDWCRLLVTGGYYDSSESKTVIVSEIAYRKADEHFYLFGVATDGTIYPASANLHIENADFTVYDDVNKIN